MMSLSVTICMKVVEWHYLVAPLFNFKRIYLLKNNFATLVWKLEKSLKCVQRKKKRFDLLTSTHTHQQPQNTDYSMKRQCWQLWTSFYYSYVNKKLKKKWQNWTFMFWASNLHTSSAGGAFNNEYTSVTENLSSTPWNNLGFHLGLFWKSINSECFSYLTKYTCGENSVVFFCNNFETRWVVPATDAKDQRPTGKMLLTRLKATTDSHWRC